MQPEPLTFQRDFAAALDVPASGAMAVYRNTVLHGALEALRANFPVVEQIVGAEMFASVAVDFATESPPTTPVLALYGAGFADWLRDQHWIGDLAYLPDVAAVERLYIECLMAADAEPVAANDVPRSDLEKVHLSLHPAVRFSWFTSPAMSIWLAHQRPISSELNIEWKAEGALFARSVHNIVHSPRIGAAAHRLLFGIRLGESVGTSLAAAAQLYPNEDCGAVFASLLNLGVFCAPAPERTD